MLAQHRRIRLVLSIIVMRQLLAFTAAFIVTLAALFLFTAWDFAWADLALAFIFAIGSGAGWWARGVWLRDNETARRQKRN